MSRLTGHRALFAWLTAVWVALWGSITWANVLGGVAVAAVLLLAFPLPELPASGRVRPLGLLRFLVFFAKELVQASLTVAWQVVRPGRPLRQAVVAVPVRGLSDRLLTVVANAVSLTPGTLALEVDRPSATLYVHVLDVAPGGADEVRRATLHLERLVVLAVGSDEAVRGLDAPASGRVGGS